jgi:hypothetical protein
MLKQYRIILLVFASLEDKNHRQYPVDDEALEPILKLFETVEKMNLVLLIEGESWVMVNGLGVRETELAAMPETVERQESCCYH